jgi:hypothetical protein
MAHINELIAIAEVDEAKVIYEMHKASCSCPVPTDCNCADEWDTNTLLNGGSAHAVLSGETLTITYINGVVATYTGTGEVSVNPNTEGPLTDSVIPVGTV